MSPLTDTLPLAVAVLAAGSSRRFGDADKLCVQFQGAPLGLAAVRQIPVDRFGHRWIITSSAAHDLAKEWRKENFEPINNSRASEGMGTSVALAARLAQEAGACALLIALADMPIVPDRHFSALADAWSEWDAMRIVASFDGKRQLPPALFGSGRFGQMALLDGDIGARELLREAVPISCPSEWLTDFDTPQQVAEFECSAAR